VKRIWIFRNVTHRGSATDLTQVWQWRAEASDGTVSVSAKSFVTLPECVADAKRCGFAGDVDPSTGKFATTHYEMKIGEYGDIQFRPR
jgi:hypothetical protein